MGLHSLLCAAGLTIVLGAGGCTSSSYTGTTAAATEHVDIFHSDSEVTRPHTAMGIVRTTASPSMPLQSIEAELVNQAQRRGADAIVIDKVELETIGYRVDTSSGEKVVTATGATDQGSGTAIRERVVSARLLKYNR
jgi:hypothetical protein